MKSETFLSMKSDHIYKWSQELTNVWSDGSRLMSKPGLHMSVNHLSQDFNPLLFDCQSRC